MGSESRKSSDVSNVEFLKLELVIQTVWVESTDSMCGELEGKLGRGDEVRSEIGDS